MGELHRALGMPPRRDRPVAPLELGVVGLSGVGKSALLNALVAPTLELVPSGGIGPLTGAPIRLGYAPLTTLTARYRDGAMRRWNDDIPTSALLACLHDHIAGPRAALCAGLEVGWPSPVLQSGLTIVDLPGLGVVNDRSAQHTATWLSQAKAILLVTDRAGIADSMVTCLNRSGLLSRAAQGQADVIGVMTKLDQVTDDLRRGDRAGARWSTRFRQVVERGEAELVGQLDTLLRHAQGRAGAACDARARRRPRVFGVSSVEHRRVVERDGEQRPRLHLAESSGIPALRRALIALARLRSRAWTSALLDRVSSGPDRDRLLPELMSRAETEEL